MPPSQTRSVAARKEKLEELCGICGESAKTMFAHFERMQEYPEYDPKQHGICGPGYPCDMADFARCLQFMSAHPQYDQSYLEMLGTLNAQWREVVRHWEDLVEMAELFDETHKLALHNYAWSVPINEIVVGGFNSDALRVHES